MKNFKLFFLLVVFIIPKFSFCLENEFYLTKLNKIWEFNSNNYIVKFSIPYPNFVFCKVMIRPTGKNITDEQLHNFNDNIILLNFKSIINTTISNNQIELNLGKSRSYVMNISMISINAQSINDIIKSSFGSTEQNVKLIGYAEPCSNSSLSITN